MCEIHREVIHNEKDSKFEDYRDINQEHRTKHKDNKLSKLTIHQKLKDLVLNESGMNFHATSFGPSPV